MIDGLNGEQYPEDRNAGRIKALSGRIWQGSWLNGAEKMNVGHDSVYVSHVVPERLR